MFLLPTGINLSKSPNDFDLKNPDAAKAYEGIVKLSTTKAHELSQIKTSGVVKTLATEKEKYVPSCVLEPYEDGAYRVGSKKWQQTKKFSIITTIKLLKIMWMLKFRVGVIQ